jgi:hypothetical protein
MPRPAVRRNSIPPSRIAIGACGGKMARHRTCAGNPMRIVSIKPHDKFKNLQVRDLKCEICGVKTSDVVARVE